jgi:hypothetical protein
VPLLFYYLSTLVVLPDSRCDLATRGCAAFAMILRFPDTGSFGSTALEVKGYLDPDPRGQVADEAEALELFLMDVLASGRR